jgi:Tol biopolymer transport system component
MFSLWRPVLAGGLIAGAFTLVVLAAILLGASQPRNQLAFLQYQRANVDIFLTDLQSNNTVNLTRNPAFDGSIAWSHDGEKLAFVSNRSGGLDIYVMDATGGDVRRLTDDDRSYDGPRWTRDGRIVFFSRPANGDWFAVRPDGSGFEQIASNDAPITGISLDLGIDITNSAAVTLPDLPGSLYLSYRSAERQWAIFMASDAARSDARMIAPVGRSGGDQIAWSTDGREIAYIGDFAGHMDLYTVSLEPGSQPVRRTASRFYEASPAFRP